MKKLTEKESDQYYDPKRWLAERTQLERTQLEGALWRTSCKYVHEASWW
jgi:hypothetical protein